MGLHVQFFGTGNTTFVALHVPRTIAWCNMAVTVVSYLNTHCFPVPILNARSTQGTDQRHVNLEVLQSSFNCRGYSQGTSELGVSKLFC